MAVLKLIHVEPPIYYSPLQCEVLARHFLLSRYPRHLIRRLRHSPDTRRCNMPYSCTPSRRICSVYDKFRRRIRDTSRSRTPSPSTLSNSAVHLSADAARVVSLMTCWDATSKVLTSGRNCGRSPIGRTIQRYLLSITI